MEESERERKCAKENVKDWIRGKECGRLEMNGKRRNSEEEGRRQNRKQR